MVTTSTPHHVDDSTQTSWPRFYFDGWYARREDAEDSLDLCISLGAMSVGIVESRWDTYGIAYFSTKVLFTNHRVDDGTNAIFAALRTD